MILVQHRPPGVWCPAVAAQGILSHAESGAHVVFESFGHGCCARSCMQSDVERMYYISIW